MLIVALQHRPRIHPIEDIFHHTFRPGYLPSYPLEEVPQYFPLRLNVSEISHSPDQA